MFILCRSDWVGFIDKMIKITTSFYICNDIAWLPNLTSAYKKISFLQTLKINFGSI